MKFEKFRRLRSNSALNQSSDQADTKIDDIVDHKVDEIASPQIIDQQDCEHTAEPVSDPTDIAKIEQSTQTTHRPKRQFQSLSPKRLMLWCFLTPLLIFAGVLVVMLFYPIGDRTPLTIDLYHQYAPFLVALRDKLTSDFNFFYSWNGGLGFNFYAMMAYYVSSPLNVLLYLFPAQWVAEAVTVLTLLKIGACGLTFGYFLRHAYCYFGQKSISAESVLKKNRHSQDQATNIGILLTATFFALSGFIVAYSWDIMWLDAIALMPLLMLGLHRMIRDGRYVLYTLIFSAILWVNYYIAFFICLFTVFYYLVVYVSLQPYLLAAKKHPMQHFLKTTGKVVGASLIGVGISAVLALPTWMALQLTSASSDQFPSVWQFSFNIFDFLSRHMMDMAPNIRDGLPNIYTGVLTFILIPLYIISGHIRLSEKVAHIALILFLFMSFNTNGLDFIWHGMHYPNQLPYRYAFVYSFVILIMCFRVLMGIRTVSKKGWIFGAIGGIAYAILAEKISSDIVDHESTYLTILFLSLYTLFAWLYLKRIERLRIVALFISVLCIAELTINTLMMVNTINEKEYYTMHQDFANDIQPLRKKVKQLEVDDPSFWRLEMVQQKTTNSPALYGYRGYTIFSSTTYQKTAALMRYFGTHGNNINSYKYTSSTAVLDAIFGIKYKINKNAQIDDPYLTEVSHDQDGYIYEYRYPLGLGFMADSDLLNWTATKDNPFMVQNQFLKYAGAQESLFNWLKPEVSGYNQMEPQTGSSEYGYQIRKSTENADGSVTLNLTVEQDQHVYFYFDPDGMAQFKATLKSASADEQKNTQAQSTAQAIDRVIEDSNHESDEVIATIETQASSIETINAEPDSTVQLADVGINEQELVDMGYRKKGDEITVQISAKADGANLIKYFVAGLNEPAFEQSMKTIQQQLFKVQQFSSHTIDGTVQAAKDGVLFLSIPYDKGWSVTVDGKPAEIQPMSGGLTLIELKAGLHTIHLSYQPQGFKLGVMISFASLLIFGLLCIASKKHRSKPRTDIERGSLDYQKLVQDHLTDEERAHWLEILAKRDHQIVSDDSDLHDVSQEVARDSQEKDLLKFNESNEVHPCEISSGE